MGAWGEGEAKILVVAMQSVSLDWIDMATSTRLSVSVWTMERERERERAHVASPPASRIHHRRQALPVCSSPRGREHALPAWQSPPIVSTPTNHLVGLPFRRAKKPSGFSSDLSFLALLAHALCHALMAWTDMDIVSIWSSPPPLRLISCLSLSVCLAPAVGSTCTYV